MGLLKLSAYCVRCRGIHFEPASMLCKDCRLNNYLHEALARKTCPICKNKFYGSMACCTNCTIDFVCVKQYRTRRQASAPPAAS